MAKNNNANEQIKLTKKDIDQVFFRNLFGLQLGWNYEKMQGLGYCYVIMPVLKKLYANDPEKMKKALKVQLGFFNSSQPMSHFIIGADMAMEEEIGMDDELAIVGLKTGLMGPFAGVGDTLFIAIYRAIVFSIAAYLALDGNMSGLIIPLVAGTGLIFLRYRFTYIGYKQGQKLVKGFATQMQAFTQGASILGLTVVGALIPSVIKFSLNLTYSYGEVTRSIQEDVFDKIMPGLLPLGIALFSYWLLGKKKMNSTKLIFILIFIGMVVGNLQSIFTAIGSIFG